MAYGLTQSIDFEAGSSQYANKTSSITGFPSGNASQTVEAWVKFESLPGTGLQMTMIGYGEDGTNNSAFQLGIVCRAGPVYHGVVDKYGAEIEGAVDLAFTTGVWYHYAARYNSGTGNITWTKDGVDVESDTAGTINTTVTREGIGARTELSSPSNFFDGRMSLARVWTEARSEAQIAANMCNVLGATTNLAAEYTLDNALTDNSGNANTLTGVNSPTFGVDTPSTCASTGPATLESWSTVAKANIETMDTSALATIESWDTVA